LPKPGVPPPCVPCIIGNSNIVPRKLLIYKFGRLNARLRIQENTISARSWKIKLCYYRTYKRSDKSEKCKIDDCDIEVPQ
jgi:hypothetical protein